MQSLTPSFPTRQVVDRVLWSRGKQIGRHESVLRFDGQGSSSDTGPSFFMSSCLLLEPVIMSRGLHQREWRVEGKLDHEPRFRAKRHQPIHEKHES